MDIKDPAKYFYACDGKVLKSLEELASALPSMSDDAYGYHANQNKNDFSDWIEFVIGDKTLAKSLKGKGKGQAEKLVKQAVKKGCRR